MALCRGPPKGILFNVSNFLEGQKRRAIGVTRKRWSGSRSATSARSSPTSKPCNASPGRHCARSPSQRPDARRNRGQAMKFDTFLCDHVSSSTSAFIRATPGSSIAAASARAIACAAFAQAFRESVGDPHYQERFPPAGPPAPSRDNALPPVRAAVAEAFPDLTEPLLKCQVLSPDPYCALAFNVSLDDLLDHHPKLPRKPGPPSRLEQLTQQLATLPRQKQKAIVDILEGYLKTVSNGHATH